MWIHQNNNNNNAKKDERKKTDLYFQTNEIHFTREASSRIYLHGSEHQWNKLSYQIIRDVS